MAELISLEEVLRKGVELGASDVHLVEGARPRCRLVGELVDMDYDVLTHGTVAKLMMPLFDLKAKQTLSDIGHLDFAHNVQGLARFRVNAFKHRGAFAMIFRVLPSKIPNFDSLGLPTSVLNLVKERRGMVLVTGVTGSGKSTTLASMIDFINQNMSKNIITLEAPVEYLHWHSLCNVCQREILRDVLTFNDGLVASLREDPDIILVGEMRDLETMETALMAAETGHLLFSTLHTMGAAETIDRVCNTFADSMQKQIRSRVASTLNAVVSQQLLPKKHEKGYVVAYELLFTSRRVKEIILSGTSIDLRDYLNSVEAKENGCIAMDDCIFNLFLQDKIASDIAVSYAFDRREMTSRINKYLTERRV